MALNPNERLDIVKLLAKSDDVDIVAIASIMYAMTLFDDPSAAKTYMDTLVSSLEKHKRRLN